jgi:rhodanese-related sulfurtransferase
MVDDVTPKQAWDALREDATARLVDVRTDYEWQAVGVPDTEATGRAPLFVQWQTAPAMQLNLNFLAELRSAGAGPEDRLYFLCRSGARSMAAAQAAQAAGFRHVFNVADGFEGPADARGQRGSTRGWQADGLPWVRR